MRQLDHRALSVPAAAARPHKPSSAASFTSSNAYAAGWVLIGAGACAYLVALGFMPELVGAGDAAGQQRPGEALSREVAALKEKVTTLSSPDHASDARSRGVI
jgi:hypothetical protein